MKLTKAIVGAVAAIVFAGTCLADVPDLRPVSRQDAQAVALGALRPYVRPAHIVRYPAVIETRVPDVRPVKRDMFLPRARWDFKPGGQLWTRAAMSAVAGHAAVLTSVVPRDIDRWCPAYADHGTDKRRAFWVGMMSALAKHESTYRPAAVGGPDLWYGLLQIYPATARGYGCRATSGAALKNPTENLSCAARIMAVTVPRDNAVAFFDRRWRGVAADWGPMTKRGKIAEMAAWTSAQSYCQPLMNMRPVARTQTGVSLSSRSATPIQD
ncbi:transglycosylase SLT domain-containing protein [Yoonia sediminilitoris]|nr:transglycosylase SLT domain-containing protein [Yoonia sediminilitoris]